MAKKQKVPTTEELQRMMAESFQTDRRNAPSRWFAKAADSPPN